MKRSLLFLLGILFVVTLLALSVHATKDAAASDDDSTSSDQSDGEVGTTVKVFFKRSF